MANQTVGRPDWAEADPAALRGLFFDLGYVLALLRFSLSCSDCLPTGEIISTRFADLERVFKKIGQMQLAGCGRLANHLALDLERYIVNSSVRWDAYCSSVKQSPSSVLTASREAQFREAFLGMWAAVWHTSLRYDDALPQCTWIGVGMQAARCERLAVLLGQCERNGTQFIQESPDGLEESPESDPPGRRAAAAEGGYDGLEGLEMALRRAGYDETVARRCWKKAGMEAMGSGTSVDGRSAYGRLRDVLRKKISLDSPFFWEELPDGSYRVAGVEVSYERYQVLGALRLADGAGFNCRDLEARTGFPSVDNQMSFLRRHPVFSAFISARGARAWVEMDAPMPPASLAARLRPHSKLRRALSA